MRAYLPSLCLLLASSACASLQGPSAGAMIEVLRAQEAAWNRGDLTGFMADGYWRSEELCFFSGGSVTRGYEATEKRYRARYVDGGAEMGRLEFTDLEPISLSPDAGIVRGRWKLSFEKAPAAEGLFTLVLRRQHDGWRIVHDHTSVP